MERKIRKVGITMNGIGQIAANQLKGYCYKRNSIMRKEDIEEGQSCLKIEDFDKKLLEAKLKPTSNYTKFGIEESDFSAPYSYLADESGEITYNGVTFQCDNLRRTLSLGDTSNPKNVIVVPLSGGGTLKVDVDSIDDLSKAIGMFSAEDTKKIMDAISVYKKAKSVEAEIEKEKGDVLKQQNVEKNQEEK